MSASGFAVGLGEYENKFRDNRIDAEVPSQLIGDDLKDIGVSAVATDANLSQLSLHWPGQRLQPMLNIHETSQPPPMGPHVSAEGRTITVMFCDLEDDCPQRLFPDEKGEGVFHIDFELLGVNASETEGVSAALTIKIVGHRTKGSGFTYFDPADQAGGVTLIIPATPTGSKPSPSCAESISTPTSERVSARGRWVTTRR
jgi:hypothetical protein